MNLLAVLKNWGVRRRLRTRKWQVEACEDRTLLAAFTVDTLFDTGDVAPGDGIVADSLGRKTLRAALDEAEATPGFDTIAITVSGTITRTFGSPGFVIREDVSIAGLGADQVTYDANGSSFFMRIFSAAVSIDGMTITGGSTGDAIGGSGIGNYGGDLTLRAVSVVGNSRSDTGGGGIAFGVDFTMGGSSGSVKIIDSLIANNTAAAGGGISIGNGAGTVEISNTTISGNTVTGDGAGIHYTMGNGTSLTTNNVTISHNHVMNDGATQIGGGIYVQGNSSPDPLPTLNNTIVAGNLHGVTTMTPDDVSGSGLSGGSPYLNANSSNTLIGDATTSGGLVNGVNGNIVGVGGAGTIDIVTILAPLADNGGPTLTHALVLGSPAVNAGSNGLAVEPGGAPLILDQRGFGFNRIISGTVDIGAYESPYEDIVFPSEDLIVFDDSTGRWKVGLSDGMGGFTWKNGPKWSTAVTWQTFSGDVNGDGFTDGIGFNSANKVFVVLNDGLGNLTTMSAGGFDSGSTFQFVMVGDFDGNGTDDLLAQLSTGEWFSRRFNTVTELIETAFYGKFTPTGWAGFNVGDFNADGADDIIGIRDSIDNTKANFIYGISNDIPMVGRRFASVFAGSLGSSVATSGWTNRMVGDWNGDDKDDLIVKHSSGQFWYVTTNGTPITTPALGANRIKLSAGAKFDPAFYPGAFYVGDFDGNGLDDIVTHNPVSGGPLDGIIRVGLTSFGGVSPSMTAMNWGTVAGGPDLDADIVGDFNGDGRDDLARLVLSSQEFLTSLSTGALFALPVSSLITGPDSLVDPGLLGSGELD